MHNTELTWSQLSTGRTTKVINEAKDMPEHESNNRAALPIADMEQDISDAAVDKEKAEGFSTLVNIRVISYRARKHDPDGVSVKAVLDGIVRRGILADDSTEQIKSITFESRKSKEEKTIIEIESCQE